MGLREINEKLRRIERKVKPKTLWKGYPPPPPLTEEQAVEVCKILFECGELNGGGRDGGLEVLSSVIGEEEATNFYHAYLCTDESHISTWYD